MTRNKRYAQMPALAILLATLLFAPALGFAVAAPWCTHDKDKTAISVSPTLDCVKLGAQAQMLVQYPGTSYAFEVENTCLFAITFKGVKSNENQKNTTSPFNPQEKRSSNSI